MSDYVQKVTDSLKNLISELSANPSKYLRRPGKDFSRIRKIDFKTFIGITLNSGGGTLSKELLDFFDFSGETPSVSAYTQQRSKVLPEAFEYLFQTFSQGNAPKGATYKGYRLLACDGSNLNIATNPQDKETAWISNKFGDVTNHLHLNALYDLLNRVYLDALIQKASDYQEMRACITMMNRSNIGKAILIADRGYENYNLIAYAANKGWNYLIRIKDINSNGMASGLNLPSTPTFDTDISITFTRKQTKETRALGYRFMPQNQSFDFLPLKSDMTYTIKFRIARFELSDNHYETVITNLDREHFCASELKKLYGMRWGIETSFRELKYAIGLTSFHAKKVDYIMQEVFSRLLLYNYCELITSHVVRHMKTNDKTKQVNFTVAIYVCREFLRQKRQLSPPEVIKLIEKHVLPVRPNRKDPRKVKPQAVVSFLYRVA